MDLDMDMSSPLGEDKGEGLGKGGVSKCGRLLGTLESREWVEQREWEARPKEAAAWVGKVLLVGEGEGKLDGVIRVVVVIGEEGQGILWTQTEEKGCGMGEAIQRNWVFKGEESGKGNIGGTERGESTVPRRPIHMGLQTIYGFDSKNCQDQ
jgi:hypothetical protein